jgi:hypothetical protein
MKKIQLTQGKVSLVDDSDFDELSKHKWCYRSDGYAVRMSSYPNPKIIRMHRVIAGTPDGMDTDHINGDKLDNRRANLRTCTRSENMRNDGKHSDSTSGYKGVTWRKDTKKWQAQLGVKYKHINLGSFDTAEEAARFYDVAANAYHGEFARTNFA